MAKVQYVCFEPPQRLCCKVQLQEIKSEKNLIIKNRLLETPHPGPGGVAVCSVTTLHLRSYYFSPWSF